MGGTQETGQGAETMPAQGGSDPGLCQAPHGQSSCQPGVGAGGWGAQVQTGGQGELASRDVDADRTAVRRHRSRGPHGGLGQRDEGPRRKTEAVGHWGSLESWAVGS